jgi:hypothetical protein
VPDLMADSTASTAVDGDSSYGLRLAAVP